MILINLNTKTLRPSIYVKTKDTNLGHLGIWWETKLSVFLGGTQMTGNQISNHLIVKGKDFGNMTNTITEDKTKRNALCGMKTE